MRGPRINAGLQVLCYRCSEVKEVRRRTYCEKCRTELERISRRSKMRSRYAVMTPEERARRTKKPRPTRPMPEVCEICTAPEARKREDRDEPQALSLDHCHHTGIFRGWLCSRCNLALGKFGDSLAGLRRALTYLENAYGVSNDK